MIAEYRLTDTVRLIDHIQGYTTPEPHEDGIYRGARITSSDAVNNDAGVLIYDDSPAMGISKISAEESAASPPLQMGRGVSG